MLRKLGEGQKRNVRHWAMEFVVVVAGVLLALWLQELLTQANQKAEARKAEATIRDELNQNLMGLVASESVDVCRRDRLREIDRSLRSGNATLPILDHFLMDIDNQARVSNSQRQIVYAGLDEDVFVTAWQSANVSGAASAMEPERYRAIAALYATFALVQQAIETDRDASAKLQLLAYGTPLTADVRAQLIEAHTIATRNWVSFHDYGDRLTARGVAKAMKVLGWNDKTRMDELIRRTEKQIQAAPAKLNPCAKPLKNPFD